MFLQFGKLILVWINKPNFRICDVDGVSIPTGDSDMVGYGKEDFSIVYMSIIWVSGRGLDVGVTTIFVVEGGVKIMTNTTVKNWSPEDLVGPRY